MPQTARAPLVTLAALLLAGCIESLAPTVPPDSREDFGDSFTYSLYLPQPAAEAQDARPEEWRDVTEVVFAHRRLPDRAYTLEIGPARLFDEDGAENDRVSLSEAIPGTTASFLTLERTAAYHLFLVDLFLPVEGATAGSGAGFMTLTVLLDAGGAAFLGAFDCPDVAASDMEWLAEYLDCEENAFDWLTPSPYIDVNVAPHDMLDLHREFARERTYRFAVDCARFPAFAETLHGFATRCYRQPPG